MMTDLAIAHWNFVLRLGVGIPTARTSVGKKRYPKQMSQAAMPLSQLSTWVVLGKSLSLPASVFPSIQELLLQTCKVNELLFNKMLKRASLM